MTKELPSRLGQVDSERFRVTALVYIRVADVLGKVNTEDAAEMTTVVHFKVTNVTVGKITCATVVY